MIAVKRPTNRLRSKSESPYLRSKIAPTNSGELGSSMVHDLFLRRASLPKKLVTKEVTALLYRSKMLTRLCCRFHRWQPLSRESVDVDKESVNAWGEVGNLMTRVYHSSKCAGGEKMLGMRSMEMKLVMYWKRSL
ncbi:hypothetical protein LOK49_LG03G03739 [Camellia lanceoleosa]|uniref:Uncharacterized protein n=1 Tax=Camellia lanceoleosa TaxID=1840588 RepID=A0ACC0IHV5_9ERIC|nr:hypothetical protein LOK49_LG03G03739 [Camellia lanceoleosa]